MAKINLRGLNSEIDNDPTYRYKMHPVNVVHQKTKSVIKNIKVIAVDLSRDPKFILEFLKKKFSIPITYAPDNESIEIKKFSKEQIQAAIYEFIEEFVLCSKCKNPETIIVTRASQLYLVCNACSYNGLIRKNNKVIEKTCVGIVKMIENKNV